MFSDKELVVCLCHMKESKCLQRWEETTDCIWDVQHMTPPWWGRGALQLKWRLHPSSPLEWFINVKCEMSVMDVDSWTPGTETCSTLWTVSHCMAYIPAVKQPGGVLLFSVRKKKRWVDGESENKLRVKWPADVTEWPQTLDWLFLSKVDWDRLWIVST